jgi:hypothetical protein
VRADECGSAELSSIFEQCIRINALCGIAKRARQACAAFESIGFVRVLGVRMRAARVKQRVCPAA